MKFLHFAETRRGERSERTGSSWLSAASEAIRLVRAGSARRAKRADWFELAQCGEQSDYQRRADSSWLSAAGLAQRGERSEPTGPRWLAWRGKRAAGFELAQCGERSELAGSIWLSAASGASRRVGAGSARRAKRAGWFDLAQRGERVRAGSVQRAERVPTPPSKILKKGCPDKRPPAQSWLRWAG